MTRDEFNEITGGFHPASVCGENCAGCVDEEEGTVPLSSLDRFSVAQLLGEFGTDDLT